VEDRPPSEARLVARAKGGDIPAYEELVRREQTQAFRVARLICGSTEDAEDACQEAFVNAYRALSRFREGAPFRPWLLRIVGNEARDRRRSRGRGERLVLALREGEERRHGDAVPSPEAALLASARREELLRAVNRLPERYRLAVACRYLLDLSEEDCAAALSCPRGTVKSRLSRALDALGRDLEEEGT